MSGIAVPGMFHISNSRGSHFAEAGFFVAFGSSVNALAIRRPSKYLVPDDLVRYFPLSKTRFHGTNEDRPYQRNTNALHRILAHG
jgi:hypothetical protein